MKNIILFLIFSQSLYGAVQYKSSFSNCPTHLVGRLTLAMVDFFNEKKSLYDLYHWMNEKKLTEKNFIKEYDIRYHPLVDLLEIHFNCPLPYAVYEKKSGERFILTGDTREVSYDYLSYLIDEDLLKREIPHLFIKAAGAEDKKESKEKIVSLLRNMSPLMLNHLGELVVDKHQDLTMIFSFLNHPVIVYYGSEDWEKKLPKLESSLLHLKEQQRIPRFVFFEDINKVTTKF